MPDISYPSFWTLFNIRYSRSVEPPIESGALGFEVLDNSRSIRIFSRFGILKDGFKMKLANNSLSRESFESIKEINNEQMSLAGAD